MIQLWHVWVIAALALFIAEMFTAGFAVVCFSLGALAAALAAGLGCPVLWQVVVFAVCSFLAFLYVRPFVLRTFFKPREGAKTNAEALVGRKGRVSTAINPEKGAGRVALDGDDWKAVSADGSPIAKGEAVEITAVEGVTLTVKPIQQNL